jgi:hypothetical protein
MARKLRSSRLWISDDDDVEHHGAAILLLVRNGIARDWECLCRTLRFDRDDRAFHSGHLALKGTIEDLVGSGLLESGNGYVGPYHVTDQAFAVIQALGLSLTQAANMPYYSGMAVRPTFGKPKRLGHVPHVFVIMPFRRDLRHVYDGPVKSACRALRFSAERADDIFSATDLLSGIWEAIVGAYIIVADCTDKNPNVFYELGIAHTLGKPVVLITQRKEDVPVDVRHIRYIKYSSTPTGLRKLERNLRKTLREVGEFVWAAEQAAAPDGGRKARTRPSTVVGRPPRVSRRR